MINMKLNQIRFRELGIDQALFVETFIRRLFDILPMYSVSWSDTTNQNQVIHYCVAELKKLGREVVIDQYNNVSSPGNSYRAAVAHTDTVGSIDINCRTQSIKYDAAEDIIYNRSGFRAMGGDDKVGVASALTIAEFLPDINVWLMANEEVGLIGSSRFNPGFVADFAVQIDRQGSTDDLVNSICGDTATRTTTEAALKLLPHRKATAGGITDIGTLVENKVAKCAFNMSCGYYLPHTSNEYIILREAIQSACDQLFLLGLMADADLEQVDLKSYNYTYGVGGYSYSLADDDLSGYEWTPKAMETTLEWYPDKLAWYEVPVRPIVGSTQPELIPSITPSRTEINWHDLSDSTNIFDVDDDEIIFEVWDKDTDSMAYITHTLLYSPETGQYLNKCSYNIKCDVCGGYCYEEECLFVQPASFVACLDCCSTHGADNLIIDAVKGGRNARTDMV